MLFCVYLSIYWEFYKENNYFFVEKHDEEVLIRFSQLTTRSWILIKWLLMNIWANSEVEKKEVALQQWVEC